MRTGGEGAKKWRGEKVGGGKGNAGGKEEEGSEN